MIWNPQEVEDQNDECDKKMLFWLDYVVPFHLSDSKQILDLLYIHMTLHNQQYDHMWFDHGFCLVGLYLE